MKFIKERFQVYILRFLFKNMMIPDWIRKCNALASRWHKFAKLRK